MSTDRTKTFMERLFRMAEIGATKNGGVCRLALSEEDRIARDLFTEWAKELGCAVHFDNMGNQFASKAGYDPGAPSLLIGSHLDSQPTGGKYDGVLGVLAGLEVIARLREENINHKHSIDVVNWTNEEGSRFAPAMIGSGVFAGVFDAEYAYSQIDSDGNFFKEELSRIGYLGKSHDKRKYRACFELHIEQGPVLESEKKQIGIVTGVQGIRWYHITIRGQEAHAGPTPMEMRSDPVRKLHTIIADLYSLADKYQPASRLTIGSIKTDPGSINTVPGSVTLSLDIRQPDNNTLQLIHEEIENICTHKYKDTELEPIWHSPSVPFHKDCIEAIENAADTLQVPYKKMFSGAGHDAVCMSRIAPTGMIFIPCKDGISHNEAEYASPDDIEAGISVLYEAVKSIIK
ncbi:MAG: M20 family metallo-hydrolase [Balneolaceae bacterium]|nr:M20 family metallo-hydrolase [Balneolaceae bacterium]